jgi:hypothetical protein
VTAAVTRGRAARCRPPVLAPANRAQPTLIAQRPLPFLSLPFHTAPKAALIVACSNLLEASMERLSQERQQLCWGLAAAGASAPTAQGSGGGGGSPAAVSGVAASAGGGALPGSGGVAALGSSQATEAAAAQGGAPAGPPSDAEMAAAATGPGGNAARAAAGSSGGLDALAEQSELAELIAANTARMGGLLQLHLTAPYAVLTDLQRARLLFQCFPIPTNAAKCAAALAHVLKFEPAALPPAAELDLCWEMARWAPPPPGPGPPPPPQGRMAGGAAVAGAAGAAAAGARDVGALSGDAASGGAPAAARPAAVSPAPHTHAREGTAT